MPDKKLTDSEIVKALEEHYKQVDKGYSTHLEYGGKGDEHEEKYIYMLRDVLDLINRLQCERNKYRRKVQNQRKEINRLKTENEMLKPFKSNLLKVMGDNIQKTKVEVVKEFAKLCIDKSQNGIIQVSDMPDYVIEMVGENNAKEE